MKKTGLALGGGAALGAAHIGVIKALEEENIKIDYITGTSIGAFVGALYGFGMHWKEIKEVAQELKWLDITSLSLSKFALLSNAKMGDLFKEHFGDKKIEDADIPMAFIATNATNGDKIILDKGSVANAIMASTCIPGVFHPVEIDDNLLIDGGIVENVPIDTVKDMGAKYVIGVDLNAKHTYDKPTNILDVILNSFHFIMMQSAKYETQGANLLIKPDLSTFKRTGIDQAEGMIEKGYEAAKSVLKNR